MEKVNVKSTTAGTRLHKLPKIDETDRPHLDTMGLVYDKCNKIFGGLKHSTKLGVMYTSCTFPSRTALITLLSVCASLTNSAIRPLEVIPHISPS